MHLLSNIHGNLGCSSVVACASCMFEVLVQSQPLHLEPLSQPLLQQFTLNTTELTTCSLFCYFLFYMLSQHVCDGINAQ